MAKVAAKPPISVHPSEILPAISAATLSTKVLAVSSSKLKPSFLRSSIKLSLARASFSLVISTFLPINLDNFHSFLHSGIAYFHC